MVLIRSMGVNSFACCSHKMQRLFAISRGRLLLYNYGRPKLTICAEARCISSPSFLGSVKTLRSTKEPRTTSDMGYHCLPRIMRRSKVAESRQAVTSLALRSSGVGKSFHTGSPSPGDDSVQGEDGGGGEETKEEREVGCCRHLERNYQAYAQEVIGCDECHPDSTLVDGDLDDLLRNIEIAKSAQTVDELETTRRRRSRRVGVRMSSPMSIDELVSFLKEEGAVDLCVIKLPPEMQYVNYFVTCSGMGTRHIGRIADSLAAELKSMKFGRAAVEGRGSEGWIAVDMGTIVVHVMSEEMRKKYELEKLWVLGRKYDDQYRELEAMLPKIRERL